MYDRIVSSSAEDLPHARVASRLGRAKEVEAAAPLIPPGGGGIAGRCAALLLALDVAMLWLNSVMPSPWIACAAALALVATLTLLFERPAFAVGLIDRPRGRKAHECPTPLTGGLAILVAASVVTWFCRLPGTILPFLIVVGLVGAIDDRHGLSARSRLGITAAVVLAMIALTGRQVTDLGNLLGTGPIDLQLASVGFTVLCSTGLVNAINMADGVDGLATGHAVTSLSALLAASWLMTDTFPPELPILIAAVLGFWILNARHALNPRAVAFLGDSGSMLLGFCLAWYAIGLSQGTQRALPPAAVLWVLGLPVVDTLRVMVRRPLKRRVSPFAGGRDHLHHILLGYGLTPAATAWTLVGINTMLCMIGVMGSYFRAPEPALTYGFLSIAVAFWFLTPRSPLILPCGHDVCECVDANAGGCKQSVSCDRRQAGGP